MRERGGGGDMLHGGGEEREGDREAERYGEG